MTVTIEQIRDVAFASDRNSVAIAPADFDGIADEIGAVTIEDGKGRCELTIATERGYVRILRDPGKTPGEISCPASARPLPRPIDPIIQLEDWATARAAEKLRRERIRVGMPDPPDPPAPQLSLAAGEAQIIHDALGYWSSDDNTAPHGEIANLRAKLERMGAARR